MIIQIIFIKCILRFFFSPPNTEFIDFKLVHLCHFTIQICNFHKNKLRTFYCIPKLLFKNKKKCSTVKQEQIILINYKNDLKFLIYIIYLSDKLFIK